MSDSIYHYLQYFAVGLIFLCIMIGFCGATPTTGAATAVGTNNATIACSGTSGAWFINYGQTNPPYWVSENQTNGDGSVTLQGGFFGSSTYYYACCDTTGCSNYQTFITGAVTPIPTQTLGTLYSNMTRNGYNIPFIGIHLIDPYIWNSNIPLTIIFMLMFSPIFIGIWVRSRSTLVAMIFGFIVSSFILFAPSSPIGISMPPEIVSLAQAFCYVSFAGAVVYVLHR